MHYSGFWINTWMGAKDQAGKDAARDSVLQLLADGTMQPDTGEAGAGFSCHAAWGSARLRAVVLRCKCPLLCTLRPGMKSSQLLGITPSCTACRPYLVDGLCVVAIPRSPPPAGKVFPLSQWAEAVAHSMKGARGGKVLLQCD